MITILVCRIDQDDILKKYGEYYYDLRWESQEKQLKYILDCDKQNKNIAVVAHPYSVLRNYFINPHLDNDGYIIDGDYECEINSKIIKYRLISAYKLYT